MRDAGQLIGMVHLQALPGSPRYGGEMTAVRKRAMEDVRALLEAGFNSIMIENFGDVPFYPHRVPEETVAAMSAIAMEIRAASKVRLGVNVLRNDGCAAMGIAAAVGADFIRVNVLCGARLTDQGIVQGIAHDLLRLRRSLGCDRVKILADVDVKHSSPLAAVPLTQEVHDLIHRGLADGVIVTGTGTGEPTSDETVRAVKAAAGPVPVYIGSGVNAKTVKQLLQVADGCIVGTAIKFGGVASEPVDGERAAALIRAARS